jgi:hypothetical protein
LGELACRQPGEARRLLAQAGLGIVQPSKDRMSFFLAVPNQNALTRAVCREQMGR